MDLTESIKRREAKEAADKERERLEKIRLAEARKQAHEERGMARAAQQKEKLYREKEMQK